jgi:ribosome assembly protein YihI (activator of Der GTPase)
MAQYKNEDAGVPDGIMNSTAKHRGGHQNQKTRMGRSYNKNGRRKDPKISSKRKLPYHKTSGKTKNQMGGCGSEGCTITVMGKS